MSAPLIYSGRRAKLLTQDGLLRPDGSIIDNNGAPNLIKNGHAEINVTGWTVSKNTVAASRPDSGFVTSSTNITWTRNTTNPIDGQADFLYTKDAANRQGEQVYCGFTVAKKYRAKVLQIEVDYLVNSGTFSAGSSSTDSDVIVYIYDVTNSTFIEPSSFKFLSNSSTIADKFVANFQTSATGSSYRILFHQATTSSSAFAVQFKEVRVSPCNYVYGTPISDWQSYTPAGTWSTNTTWTGFWRRVGQDMEVKFQASLSGAPSGNFTANIPSGYTIDTTKLLSTGTQEEIGFGRINDSGVALYHFSLRYNSTVSIIGINLGASGTYLNEPSVVDATTPITFGASDIVNGYFKVPITGWSSSVQVSDGWDGRQIVFVGKNSASTSIATTGTYVPFTSQKDSTASWSTDTFTCPSYGDYEVKAGLHGSSASNYFYAQVDKNGTLYARILQNESRGDRLATGSVIVYNCSAGETIKLKAYSDTSSQTLNASADLNFISIIKLQAPTTMSATEVVAARYYLASNTAFSTGTVQVPYDTKVYDTHGAYSTSTFKFTAPVAGFYRITITFNTTASLTETVAYRIDATTSYYLGTASSVGRFNGSDTFYLNAGQTVEPMSAGSGGTYAGGATGTFFTIERIK